MRIAVSMWSVHKEFYAGRMTVTDFVRWAGTTACQGVELLDVFWKDPERELSEVKDALHEAGLAVGAYAVGNNFGIPDEAKREAQLQVITKGIDMAERLGARVVRVFAGDLAEGVSFDAARGWIISGLSRAASYAEKKGITLALENHGKLAGRSSQVKGIIEDVGSHALKATIDTGNFLLVDENPSDAVSALARLASHVHFKDFRPYKEGDAQHYTALSGKQFVGTIAGEGMVDLKQALQELQRAEYTGWLSVEFEGLEDEKQGTIRSIDNLMKTLNSM